MFSDRTLMWLEDHNFDPAQPDNPGRYNDTALILASRKGELPVVQELLTAGVNVNHRNMDGTNALWAAVVADSVPIAEALLAAGVDLNNLNDNGATVLMYASSSGKTPWVQYLLEKGADTHLKTLDDFSALDLAANADILRLLRKVS